MYLLSDVSYWISLALAPLAAGFLAHFHHPARLRAHAVATATFAEPADTLVSLAELTLDLDEWPVFRYRELGFSLPVSVE